MPDADLRRRIEMFENAVESLRRLPAEVNRLGRRMGRTESQILQLRSEMRDEFSALRRDMAMKADLADGMSRAQSAATVELTAGLHSLRTELRTEIHDSVAAAVRELSAAIAETRGDIRTLADAQRHTTVLVEDVIGRLKTIAKGNRRTIVFEATHRSKK
jgi:phage-related minor tail protein